MKEGRTTMTAGATDWGPWQSVMEEAVSSCVTRASRLADALNPESTMSHQEFRNNALALYEFADQVLERCDDIERWAELGEEVRHA
jgi:hypothetical protein